MRPCANCILALVLAPLPITWASGQAPSAAPGVAATIDRTVLPLPEQPFRGKIETAYKDSKAYFPEALRAPEGAPNVLLIMGDDLGYGHMSAFGGPANPPTFDRLAEQGLRFTNFHTTAVCAASRAALLTGRNAHAVGMGGVPETAVGFPGYNSIIPRSAATVFEILRQNGYGTAWVGKTHLTPLHEISSAGPFDRWPTGMGAEYFYGFFGAGVSQWYPPLWENTTPLRAPKTPEQGYHLEADMADQTVGWIQRQKSIHPGKPWMAYYAPTAHKPPVGVPSDFIMKYRGKFDKGCDKLREQTLARQIKLGIVPPGTRLAPQPAGLPACHMAMPARPTIRTCGSSMTRGAISGTPTISRPGIRRSSGNCRRCSTPKPASTTSTRWPTILRPC